MRHLLGKLGFIHRRLWRRDGLYRAALLFGPAPLLGCLLAVTVWEGVLAVRSAPQPPPPWAAPQSPASWNTDAAPQTLQPVRPLPATDASGGLTGYEPGWRASINPIEVGTTMDVDVKAAPLSTFTHDGPAVEMSRILAMGPPDSLYVGIGRGFLAVRTAGIHALTLRVERPAGAPADCLMRLGLGPRRIVSNVQLQLARDFDTVFDAARFDLKPGLYPIAWAFGCWRGHDAIGPGRLTVLVGHPDDQSPQPARPDDIVREGPGG